MRRILPALLLLLISSFTVSDQPGCAESRLFEKAPFHIGTALNTDKLKNEENYWKTAMAQFNSFTPEKILKPQYVHPARDVFDFNEADHLMAFCREHHIRLHGHTLVWHRALPAWIEHFKGSQEEWEALLKEHVQTIVRHCKGYIKSWDVVNEAFNDDGTLRKNIWLKNIGDSYIEKAFRYAAEVDPTAKLFYNDFSIEKPGHKLASVLELMTHLRSKGVKVDGIGMQMHVSLEFPRIEEINEAAMKIQQSGFMVHYSELDVSLTADQKLFVSGKKRLQQQKDRMREIVRGYMKLRPETRFGITLWGVSDNDSWLTEERMGSRPLLFNMRYKMKPAYCGFIEGLAPAAR